MQINLGMKIRELRKRDGRTQEALADALGVTCQAVSRWEANGGYPDTEIIPVIANYFNVTIDELFGYNGDREEKIKKILADADNMLDAYGDMEQCVSMLRIAVAEFPSNTQILLRLGHSLIQYGWKKHGARRHIKDGSEFTVNDIVYNSDNEYWREALLIYNKVLEIGLNPDDRLTVITAMIRHYSLMGEYVKAEELARKQDSAMISREYLLSDATDGDERDLYQGEALLAFANQTAKIIINAVMTKASMRRNETGLQKLLGAAHLLEVILDDENCGSYHFDLGDLYFWCSAYTAWQGNLSKAMEYFDIGFEHKKKYDTIRGQGIYHYTSSLISKVTSDSNKWMQVPVGLTYMKTWLSSEIPENMLDAIKSNNKYAECFVNS
ncbi:MAG: helix-turn-helix transcriptional regulator [Eubacteriales bacterium]